MKLLIAGAGGHGRVVADLAQATRRFTSIAFVDDRHPGLSHADDWPVIGTLGDLDKLARDHDALAVAIGDARIRVEVLGRATRLKLEAPALVHPSAAVSPHATLGPGTVICAGAVVSIGARLGVGCIVNSNAVVDHDCRLGDGVHVAPGALLAGEVIVGPRSWIGIGASIRQQVAIGDDVIVGAGAVCVAQVRSGVTVVGVPAREVNRE